VIRCLGWHDRPITAEQVSAKIAVQVDQVSRTLELLMEKRLVTKGWSAWYEDAPGEPVMSYSLAPRGGEEFKRLAEIGD
jgi:predicted ArsR family transcriptional regulator